MPTPCFGSRPDVLTVGLAYRDIVFTGLHSMPSLGTEVYADARYETWGGIANQARVCAALGMATALCTAVGDDDASRRFLTDLAALGVDTSPTMQYPNWCLPTTVALTSGVDRALVTVEEPPPAALTGQLLDAVPRAPRAAIVDLRDAHEPAIEQLRQAGTRMYASRGYDPSGRWDARPYAGLCDVWMLNAVEARGFTDHNDPVAAARELTAIAPTVVVTRGADGLVAATADGQEAHVAAFDVDARNLTGAGDTTLAALVFADQLPALTLAERLDVAAYITAATISDPRGVAHPLTLRELTTRLDTAVDPRIARLHHYIHSLQKVELS